MSIFHYPYDHTEEEIKGYLFERSIVARFREEIYILHDWRSDKKLAERYPLSSKKPDLVFEQRNRAAKMFFAIECKWRNAVWLNNYSIISKIHLDTYDAFARKNKMTVLIALGIGGTPESPDKCFLAPLDIFRRNMNLKDTDLLKYCWPDNIDIYIKENVVPRSTIKRRS